MYLTIKEAAKKLHMGTSTLYQLLYKNEIPAYKIGNKWLFDEVELDSWVKSHGAQKETQETT